MRKKNFLRVIFEKPSLGRLFVFRVFYSLDEMQSPKTAFLSRPVSLPAYPSLDRNYVLFASEKIVSELDERKSLGQQILYCIFLGINAVFSIYTRVRDKKRLVKVGNLVKNSYLYR